MHHKPTAVATMSADAVMTIRRSRRRSDSGVGGGCVPRGTHGFLGLTAGCGGSTLLVIAFAAFPDYVGHLFDRADTPPGAHVSTHGETRSFRITGMTCEACAVTLENALESIPVAGTSRCVDALDRFRLGHRPRAACRCSPGEWSSQRAGSVRADTERCTGISRLSSCRVVDARLGAAP